MRTAEVKLKDTLASFCVVDSTLTFRQDAESRIHRLFDLRSRFSEN